MKLENNFMNIEKIFLVGYIGNTRLFSLKTRMKYKIKHKKIKQKFVGLKQMTRNANVERRKAKKNKDKID